MVKCTDIWSFYRWLVLKILQHRIHFSKKIVISYLLYLIRFSDGEVDSQTRRYQQHTARVYKSFLDAYSIH